MNKDLENLCEIALEGYKMLQEAKPEALGAIGFDIVKNRIFELKFLLESQLKGTGQCK